MMAPLAPGEHQLHQQVNSLGALSTLNAKINVFELATESLAVGQPYTQDFDTLGLDGSAEVALPNAWTVTDENAFNVYQHETAASFPITTSAQGAYPFAMSAGVPGETDRALSIYALRDSEVRRHQSSTSQLQFLADADGSADSLQVQFDIEAWDASTSSLASDPGEAAFDVTIDIDSGNGFEPLLDLGRITTGQLQRPDGDYLNGNDATNRVSFDSGHLPASIPDGSQLRFRWATAADANTDGWVFGLDNVAVTLLSDVAELAGDFNGDGSLGIDDLDTLSLAIQANSVDSVYDLDDSGQVDLADRMHWVTHIKQTWIGDTNLDGEVNSGDLIAVFQEGKYETGQQAGWAEGDWDGDGVFGSGDLVAAFQDGGYEQGPRASASAVPEPSSALLLFLAAMLAVSTTRRKRL